MTDYAARAQAAHDAHEAALRVIANDIRTHLVVPACERHGLRFDSGNGTYLFTGRGERRRVIGSNADAVRCGIRDMAPVFDALDIAGFNQYPVGSMVDDVPMPVRNRSSRSRVSTDEMRVGRIARETP